MIRIINADHTNWRVRDIEASLRFYRDLLGLEPFGLEEYERGERSLVSLRVTQTFILHLRVDPAFEPADSNRPTGGYDHLALVADEPDVETLTKKLQEAGLEIENSGTGVTGARGEGDAVYVRDPDGYLIELKLYDS